MKRLLFLLFVCTVYACSSDKNIINDFGSLETLESRPLGYDGLIIWPENILLQNDKVILNDLEADYFFTVIDANSGQLVRHLVRQGQGPNEISTKVSLTKLHGSNDTFYFSGFINRTFYHSNKTSEIDYDVIGEFPIDQMGYQSTLQLGNYFIGANSMKEKLVLSNKKSLMDVVNYSSLEGSLKALKSGLVLNGYLTSSSHDSENFFYGSQDLGYIELYSIVNDGLKLMKRIELSDKIETKITKIRSLNSDDKMIYIHDMQATKDRLFVLYYNVNMNLLNETPDRFRPQILVFDTSLNFLESKELDQFITKIAVDENGHFIVGLNPTVEEDMLLRFSLK